MTNITTINKLENQISELLKHCQHLESENSALQVQLKSSSTERSNLLEQKEKARTQVESMITRLRSLEHS